MYKATPKDYTELLTNWSSNKGSFFRAKNIFFNGNKLVGGFIMAGIKGIDYQKYRERQDALEREKGKPEECVHGLSCLYESLYCL